MKSWSSRAFVVLMAVGALACAGDPDVKIGAILSLSGPGAGQLLIQKPDIATDIDREAGNWQKSGLQNRGILDVMIKVPENTTTEQREEIRKRWKKRQTGSDNAREPVITSGDVKNLNTTASEMDFVNSRKAVWSEIAAAFGVPLAALGFTENVNLANAKQMDQQLWKNTIIPQLRRIRNQINLQIAKDFPGYCIDFDLSNVEALQDDLNDKLSAAERLMRLGYTRNEINQKLELGFDDDPTGDVRYEPVGMLPIGSVDDMGDDEPPEEEAKRLTLIAYGKKTT